jgi:rhodanese-related sulfurtransferase
MPTSIATDELRGLLVTAQLVEVLPADEFDQEHLPGARNIPLKELGAEVVDGLERDRPVVVYCFDYQ